MKQPITEFERFLKRLYHVEESATVYINSVKAYSADIMRLWENAKNGKVDITGHKTQAGNLAIETDD